MNHDLAFEVDRHGVLRIPALFWLAMALLARHWVLLLVVIVTARRQSSAWGLLGEGGIPWGWLALEAPILLLAAAGFYRQPDAGAWARWLWRHGREIVVLAVVLNLGWTGKLLLESSYWTLWPELFLASCCVLDLAIALAMTTTPYYRQMFAEFPARPEADGKAA